MIVEIYMHHTPLVNLSTLKYYHNLYTFIGQLQMLIYMLIFATIYISKLHVHFERC